MNSGVLFPVIMLAAITVCSGCVSSTVPGNASGSPTIVTASPSPDLTAVPAGIPENPTEIPARDNPGRETVNVLRGEPVTLNATVKDRSIRQVQVWFLNGTVSSSLLPVTSGKTFQVTLDPGITRALSRNFTSAVLIQYPDRTGNFSVRRDTATGNIIRVQNGEAEILRSRATLNAFYPSTQVDYLQQDIKKGEPAISSTIFFLNGVDAWITILPQGPVQPGTLVVQGNTTLPPGTALSVGVVTASFHPTPKYYDFSHEMAAGETSVIPGTGGINRYSATINTSRLYTGTYLLKVSSADDEYQADATSSLELIAPPSQNPGAKNFINWSTLSLPPLQVNKDMAPVMLSSEWKIVPPGNVTQNNEVPYGSIIDCGADGICRVFNESGIQFLAVYDSNQGHIMEVPNGAMIDAGIGNVTLVKLLNGTVILTKIDEYSRES